MKKLLIVAHPGYEESHHVKYFIEEVKKKSVNTDVHILDSNGNFNIDEEQDRLLKYDIIGFVYPMWWYTYPWILKKWMEEILTPDFAFSFKGSIEGFKLRGKKFLIVESIGSPEELYQTGKGNYATVHQHNTPLIALFHFLNTGFPAGGEVKVSHPEEFLISEIYMFGSKMDENANNYLTAVEKYLEIDKL